MCIVLPLFFIFTGMCASWTLRSVLYVLMCLCYHFSAASLALQILLSRALLKAFEIGVATFVSHYGWDVLNCFSLFLFWYHVNGFTCFISSLSCFNLQYLAFLLQFSYIVLIWVLDANVPEISRSSNVGYEYTTDVLWNG